MNKVLTAAAAAALLAISASASSAQDPTANIKITANEPVVCGFFPPSGTPGPGVGTGPFKIASDVNDLQNIRLEGLANDFRSVSELQVQFDAFCNTEFTLRAKTDEGGKLVNKDAPAGTSLIKELPYTFRIRVVDTSPSVQDNFDPAPSSFQDATAISNLTDINAKLNITIFPENVSGNLYAGDFVDTIRLEIGPKTAPTS